MSRIPLRPIVCVIGVAILGAIVAAPCHASLIYSQGSQFPGSFNALTSQSQSSGGGFQAFDDFALSSAESIVSITFQGFYWNPRGPSFNPPALPSPQKLQIGFYANQNNLPGSQIGSFTTLDDFQFALVGTAAFGPDLTGQYDTVDVYNFAGNLHTSFNALANTTYWVSIVSEAGPTPPQWLWTSGTGGDSKSAQLQYGAANATYVLHDRTFGLWNTVQEQLVAGTPPATPPTGTLADVPEPAGLSLAAIGMVCAAAGFRRRARRLAHQSR